MSHTDDISQDLLEKTFRREICNSKEDDLSTIFDQGKQKKYKINTSERYRTLFRRVADPEFKGHSICEEIKNKDAGLFIDLDIYHNESKWWNTLRHIGDLSKQNNNVITVRKKIRALVTSISKRIEHLVKKIKTEYDVFVFVEDELDRANTDKAKLKNNVGLSGRTGLHIRLPSLKFSYVDRCYITKFLATDNKIIKSILSIADANFTNSGEKKTKDRDVRINIGYLDELGVNAPVLLPFGTKYTPKKPSPDYHMAMMFRMKVDDDIDESFNRVKSAKFIKKPPQNWIVDTRLGATSGDKIYSINSERRDEAILYHRIFLNAFKGEYVYSTTTFKEKQAAVKKQFKEEWSLAQKGNTGIDSIFKKDFKKAITELKTSTYADNNQHSIARHEERAVYLMKLSSLLGNCNMSLKKEIYPKCVEVLRHTHNNDIFGIIRGHYCESGPKYKEDKIIDDVAATEPMESGPMGQFNNMERKQRHENLKGTTDKNIVASLIFNTFKNAIDIKFSIYIKTMRELRMRIIDKVVKKMYDNTEGENDDKKAKKVANKTYFSASDACFLIISLYDYKLFRNMDDNKIYIYIEQGTRLPEIADDQSLYMHKWVEYSIKNMGKIQSAMIDILTNDIELYIDARRSEISELHLGIISKMLKRLGEMKFKKTDLNLDSEYYSRRVMGGDINLIGIRGKIIRFEIEEEEYGDDEEKHESMNTQMSKSATNLNITIFKGTNNLLVKDVVNVDVMEEWIRNPKSFFDVYEDDYYYEETIFGKKRKRKTWGIKSIVTIFRNMFNDDHSELFEIFCKYYSTALNPKRMDQRVLFLISPGGSGKSSFGDFLTRLFSSKIIASINGDCFDKKNSKDSGGVTHIKTLISRSRIANVNEASNNDFSSDKFKEITGEIRTVIRELYCAPRTVDLNARCAFLLNKYPGGIDTSDYALERRPIVITSGVKFVTPREYSRSAGAPNVRIGSSKLKNETSKNVLSRDSIMFMMFFYFNLLFVREDGYNMDKLMNNSPITQQITNHHIVDNNRFLKFIIKHVYKRPKTNTPIVVEKKEDNETEGEGESKQTNETESSVESIIESEEDLESRKLINLIHACYEGINMGKLRNKTPLDEVALYIRKLSTKWSLGVYTEGGVEYISRDLVAYYGEDDIPSGLEPVYNIKEFSTKKNKSVLDDENRKAMYDTTPETYYEFFRDRVIKVLTGAINVDIVKS